nr:uncharacterized protein LOC127346878 [Lolium perenne]
MKLLNNCEDRDQKTEKTSAPQSTKTTTSANKTQINADIVASNQPSSEDGVNRETVDHEELLKPLNSLVAPCGKRSLRLSLKRRNATAKEDRTKSANGIGMQICSILSYITKKLYLASDDKLEILCNEWWPICPSTTLGCLLEQCLSSKPKHKVRATVGSPAKEFVMELSYRRRPAPYLSVA